MDDYADDSYDSPRTRRPRQKKRRGGSWLLFLLGLLLVIGALVVVGDRVAAKYANDKLREQVVVEMSNNGVAYDSLDVAIGGFPFLTQVIKGNYDDITIDMANVKLPADKTGTTKEVVLPKLHVVASSVAADTKAVIEGDAQVTAKQVTGTAVVSFATLQGLADFSAVKLTEVAISEDQGGLKVSAKTNLAGVVVPIAATADITVAEGVFQVKLRDLSAVNLPAPAVIRDYLTNLANQTLSAKLPPLPFGMNLDQVTVDGTGLAITATGRDVPLVK